MNSRQHILVVLVSVIALLLGATTNVSAETLFVPIDFGASYEPKQLNTKFVDLAKADGRFGMKSEVERDQILNEHFPELNLPNVVDLEQRFTQGKDHYFGGEYEEAREVLSAALDDATGQLVTLSLRPGFAETTYQSGLYLVQALFFVLQEKDQAEVVVEKLVKHFPTQAPSADQFPPELIDVFRKYQPTATSGKNLTIKVGADCKARLNGRDVDVPGGSVNILVLPGDYGVAEVCNEETKRAFIVPVTSDTVLDFHDGFATSFTYPQSRTLNAKTNIENLDVVATQLATIGQRVGASHIVGAGLVPASDGSPDGYRLIYVDANTGAAVRTIVVNASDVATDDGMNDAINVLYTGQEFEVISKFGETGEGFSLTVFGAVTAGVGVAVAGGGVAMALLAKGAHDDFILCNADPECRASDNQNGEDFIKDRELFAKAADALFISGGIIAAAGLTIIIIDLASSGGSEASASSDEGFQFGIAPTQDGAAMSFGWTW